MDERTLKFKKIMSWVTGAKVFCIFASVLYFFYSIWRFFKLPLTEKLAPLMDILLIPLKWKFNTIKEFGENQLEVGYIIVSIVFIFLAFVFWTFQAYVPIAETQEELEEIKFKKKQEEDLNKELHDEYIASIEAYKIFSIFVKLRYSFSNQAFIDREKVNLDDLAEVGLQNIVNKMRADFPAMRLQKRGDNIFLTCKTFERFDLVLSYLLNCIKDEKNAHLKDGIMADFIIAVDSQKSDAESEISYSTCNSISKLEYVNKAVTTFTFKQRYDLFGSQTKFKTDYLCDFTTEFSSDNRELFNLKSRPKTI